MANAFSIFVDQFSEEKLFDVIDILVEKIKMALEKYPDVQSVVVAGGVSANSYIREKFLELEKTHGMKVYYPTPILCTDNAAMIACAGYYNYINGKRSDLYLNAVPNLKLGEMN